MKNLVTKEYRDLISKKLFLEREIDKLPIGYISKKTIKGRVQFYLQRREGNKVTSIYIKFEDVDISKDYYCLFRITDSQGNEYTTNVVKIKDK